MHTMIATGQLPLAVSPMPCGLRRSTSGARVRGGDVDGDRNKNIDQTVDDDVRA